MLVEIDVPDGKIGVEVIDPVGDVGTLQLKSANFRAGETDAGVLDDKQIARTRIDQPRHDSALDRLGKENEHAAENENSGGDREPHCQLEPIHARRRETASDYGDLPNWSL